MERSPEQPPSEQELLAEAHGAWAGIAGPRHGWERARAVFGEAYRGYFPTLRHFTRDHLTSIGAYQTLDEMHHALPAEVRPYVYFDLDTYESRLPFEIVDSRHGGVHVFDEGAVYRQPE